MLADMTQLESAVSKAFNNVLDPTQIADFVDQRDWESRELLELLLRRTACRLSDEEIEAFKQALPAFTPLGLIYILPQYLMYSARNIGSDVYLYVLYFLSSEAGQEKLTAARADQRQAVCQYLKFVVLRDANCALEKENFDKAFKYWCMQELETFRTSPID